MIIIDAQSPLDIICDQSEPVIIFDQTCTDTPLQRRVRIMGGTQVTWYGLHDHATQYSLDFEILSGSCRVRTLLLSHDHERLDIHMKSHLLASDTRADMHIISLVGERGEIHLDGVVHIDQGIARVAGHILEENVFLGSHGQIYGIPSLLVHSDDVEAGHAARIERISDEKLYYLRARGIPKDDATVMMLVSQVTSLFAGLDDCFLQQALLALEKSMGYEIST